MNRIPAMTAVAAVCLAPALLAAEDRHPAPLVVTPTLSAQTVDDSLSSVTIIDRETLDRQQPRELSELLRGQPGVDLITNGAYGKNTTLFMRGTGSESTVLLINGVRLRSATSGGAPWQFIPPQLLDRVEIVRGPRSSIYGADAVGGVVQGFTPEGEGDPSGWIQLGAGSNSSQEIGGGVSGRVDNTSYSLAANWFETDGIPVRDGEDRKGFDSVAGIGSVRQHLANGGSIGVTGFRAEGNTEFDTGDTDYMVQTLGVSADYPLTDNWIAELSVSEGRDEALNDDDSEFNTRSRTVRGLNRFLINRHELVLGAEYLHDKVRGSTDYDEDSRYNTALFGQLFLNAGPADFQFSLRWDDNEAFGEQITGAVAAGYNIDGIHRVRISHGTAFRAPSFNDLYFPNFGNPDLDPERSRTTEVGVSGRRHAWFWDVAVFQTDVRDLIVLAENVDRARIRGVELGAGAHMGQWTVYGAATAMDPKNRETDNRLRRRSTESARLDVDRDINARWSAGGSVILQGDRYDDAANDIRLAGYGLLNLRTSWRFAENWSARLTLDNVFDKEYAVARFFDGELYNQAGRTAFLSVRYGHR